MAIMDALRSDLSKILLVACDQSYANDQKPEGQFGASLAPFTAADGGRGAVLLKNGCKSG